MISENLIGKKEEGRGRGLILGVISAFVCKGWKTWKLPARAKRPASRKWNLDTWIGIGNGGRARAAIRRVSRWVAACLLACLHFPRCAQLYVTCPTPTDTRKLSFCGSLVERPLLATLAIVNSTVQQRSCTCEENSCADRLCTGLDVSAALIRSHLQTVQTVLLYCTLFNLWVTDGVWQNPYAKRKFPNLIWYLIT